jgi:hypothetical protein
MFRIVGPLISNPCEIMACNSSSKGIEIFRDIAVGRETP